MKGPGIKREDETRTYIDDCLDQVHRIACGRPCPDRDHCRTRLVDILHAIVVAPRLEASGDEKGKPSEKDGD